MCPLIATHDFLDTSSSSSSVLFQALGPYTHKIYIKHTHKKHTNHANTDTGKCLFEKVKICFAYANTKKVEPAD